jgi:hypothetical protein
MGLLPAHRNRSIPGFIKGHTYPVVIVWTRLRNSSLRSRVRHSYDRRRPPKNSKVKSSQANEAEVANEAAKRHQVAAVRLSVPSSTCCCASGESTR